MDFLGRLVRGALSTVVPGLVGPLQVREVSLADYRGLEPVARDGSLTLLRVGNSWDGLLQPGPGASTALRLFRVSGEPEAGRLFALLCERVLPLVSGPGGAVWPGGGGTGAAAAASVQRVLDALREHPDWTPAHLAAHAGLVHAFRHNTVLRDVESAAGGAPPLSVAVRAGELACVSELLACGARADARDDAGDTPLHLAARRTDTALLQWLCEAARGSLDGPNGAGETALHEACRLGREDAARVLILAGASTAPCTAPGTAPGAATAAAPARGHAVHTALRHDKIGCVQLLLDMCDDQLGARDAKHSASPMHWARSGQAVRLLAARGAPLEARSANGDMPLHVMARKRRHEAALALLSQGAAAETRGARGDTPLHIAMRMDQLEMIKPLIVFGAQMDSTNDDGETPGLLLARSSSGSNRPVLMEMLHSVGVTRCFPPGAASSSSISSTSSPASSRPGTPARPPPPRPARPLGFDDVIGMATVLAPMLDMIDGPTAPAQRSERVLSLDGGGIRGLVLIQMLLALERESGRPIRELFDWIAGTSTGGILALGIVHGKSLSEMRALYFRMKDEVFQGGRPYDAAPLDIFLQRELGEHTKMTDVTHPKVLVTAVLADRHPAELHLFRNYTPPTPATPPESPSHSPKETFQPLTLPSEQLVWRAARSSGAAPTYFRQMGRFLDGGLLANNPTLDALTELQQYRVQQGCKGPLRAVVLSLGTGRPPKERVASADVFRPANPWQLAQSVFGARELGRIMVDCCTDADGRPVDRARAWCDSLQVPFFRLSPQLREDVALDEVRDAVLMDALWDTEVYLHSQRAQIAALARLLSADT